MSSITLSPASPLTTVAQPEAAALRQLTILVWLILLLPQLSGMDFRGFYAYVLVGWLGFIFAYVRMNTWEALPKLARQAIFGGLVGALVYSLSICASTVTPVPGDFFQLLREPYPYFALAATTSAWSNVRFPVGQQFLKKVVNLFLASIALGMLLQAVVPAVSDILFRYYYIECNDDSLRGYMSDRPGLTFGNPNVLGFAVAILALSGIAMRTMKMRDSVLVAALAGGCILWTASRTAMAAFAVGLIWIVCVNRPRLIFYGCLLLGICVAFKLAGITWGDEMIGDFFERFFQESSSLDERRFIWLRLLESVEFKSNWLLGVGPHTSEIFVVDSGYVLMLYRYGVVGLLAMLAWYGWLLCSAIPYFRDRDRHDFAVQRVALMLALLVASYGMAPLTDPRLCTLFCFLFSATCLRPAGVRRQNPGYRTPGTVPCAC